MFWIPAEVRLLSIAFQSGRLALEDRNSMSTIQEMSPRYAQAWAAHDLDAIMVTRKDTHLGGTPALAGSVTVVGS